MFKVLIPKRGSKEQTHPVSHALRNVRYRPLHRSNSQSHLSQMIQIINTLIDFLPHLPAVVRGCAGSVYNSDPTQETCARSCRSYEPHSVTWARSYKIHNRWSICLEKSRSWRRNPLSADYTTLIRQHELLIIDHTWYSSGIYLSVLKISRSSSGNYL